MARTLRRTKAATNVALGATTFSTSPPAPGHACQGAVGACGRVFRSAETWVGHFFINFHGGTRTISATNPNASDVPLPLPPSPFHPQALSMLQYENVENRNDEKKNTKGKAEKQKSSSCCQVVGVFCANESRGASKGQGKVATKERERGGRVD